MRAVERVFQRLETEMKFFVEESGISCPASCGACCSHPDIEASPLEFLPYALFIYDSGKSTEFLEELKTRNPSICVLFRPGLLPGQGKCDSYRHRGLICRLFGYSARRNRLGSTELVTCAVIKNGQGEQLQEVKHRIESGMRVPMMNDYYHRLSAIDASLATLHPINTSMQLALEYVMHYYGYRKRRPRKPGLLQS